MIDVDAAKKRVLQLAITGCISERCDAIKPATDIPIDIETEYSRLLDARETKKKKSSPMIIEGTFAIPSSWEWVSLGSLCIFLSRGRAPKYSKEELYPVFAQKCNQPTGLALEKARFLDKDTLDKWAAYFRLRDGDIVINSTGTGTMGRVGYFTAETLNNKYPFMLPDSHVTVVRLGNGVLPKYIYYALRSTAIQAIMEMMVALEGLLVEEQLRILSQLIPISS